MNIKLPEDFTNRMRLQLGDELTAFLHALEEPPLRGILPDGARGGGKTGKTGARCGKERTTRQERRDPFLPFPIDLVFFCFFCCQLPQYMVL